MTMWPHCCTSQPTSLWLSSGKMVSLGAIYSLCRSSVVQNYIYIHNCISYKNSNWPAFIYMNPEGCYTPWLFRIEQMRDKKKSILVLFHFSTDLMKRRKLFSIHTSTLAVCFTGFSNVGWVLPAKTSNLNKVHHSQDPSLRAQWLIYC